MSIPAEFLLVATLIAATGVAAVTEAATPPRTQVAQVAQVARVARVGTLHAGPPTITISDAVLVLAQR